jgi:hypothetical protein
MKDEERRFIRSFDGVIGEYSERTYVTRRMLGEATDIISHPGLQIPVPHPWFDVATMHGEHTAVMRGRETTAREVATGGSVPMGGHQADRAA